MSWHDDLLGDGGTAWPRLLLFALAATVLISFGTAAATSSTAFGPYNPSWDGASDVRQAAETESNVERHLIRDTAMYEELPANGTVAFVITPDEPYEGEDTARMQEFVAEGGTLVVLENFDETGNDLLADVGAEARTDGQLLRDERNHYRGPTMPVATNVENHTLTTGVDRLTLNYATAVEPGNATVLVATSEYAYLGSEDDDLDEQDDLRSYPVATVENVSNGQVIVIGDPSVTINAMYDEPDNAAFVRGLYTDADHVVFDRSHSTEVPPLAAALLVIRDSPLFQLLLGTLGIGLVATISRVRVRSVLAAGRSRLSMRFQATNSSDSRDNEQMQPGLSTAERTAYLRERHPDWDKERIQRVITALNHPRSEREKDE